MQASRAQLLETLEQTQPILVRLTSSLNESALDFRAGEREWSIREILAHLVDDEMFIMRVRMARIVKEENPALVSHDEKHWHTRRNISRDALDTLLSDFALQRSASLNILTFLSESDWSRTATHPEYGQFTAEEWLGHWAEHDVVHIQQIEEIIAIVKGVL